MIFYNNEAISTTLKREGTSQTYGQLVTLPTARDVTATQTTSLGQASAVSPRDTIVKIIPNTQGDDNSSFQLNDIDRSKISIAAFSNNANPTVALNQTPSNATNLGNNQLPQVTNVQQNASNQALVVGSAIKSRDDIKKVLDDAKKVDLMITLKSKESEILEFNNLKEITPDSTFVYNFFEETEEDIDSQEDQSKDPLLASDISNVPKYVKLTWDSIVVTEPISDPNQSPMSQEINAFKKKTFKDKKGVLSTDSVNFKNSFVKSQKQTTLYNKEGISTEVTDIHNLDVAMNSTSNKKVFANTINAVLNANKSQNVVSNLPIKTKIQ